MRKIEPGYQVLEKGWALLEAGATADAVEAFKAAAQSGVAAGYVELACVERERGNLQAAGNYMRQAEGLADEGDALACLSCSLAYQLGNGDQSVEEQGEKARYFLRRAADLGLPDAQLMLAQQLLWGLNDDVEDERQYTTWIWRAIDQGLDEAVIAHVKNMLELERPIEPRLITELEALATRSEEARALLKKVAPA